MVYLNDKLCKIYELVRKNLKTNAKRQKRDYDTRIIFHAYSVGDIVYVLDSSRIVGKSPKLKREVWKGPFIVVSKISDILYQVKGPPKTKSKIVHHDRIRRFKCNSIPQWVLSLQQDLKAGNTFVDTAVKRPIKQKQRNSKLIKQNSKAWRRQNLSSEPEQMLGKRKRKPLERLEL